jgi:hypothetical protein
MKRNIPTLMAVLVLSLCGWRVVEAQVPGRGGMFGARKVGQSFVPRVSNFDGGIQTGASGDFLNVGRQDGFTVFVTPWRRSEPLLIETSPGTPLAAQAALPAASQRQSLAPSELPANLNSAASSSGETTVAGGVGAAEQVPNMPLHRGSPAVSGVAIALGEARAEAAPATQAAEYTRSARLSDFLTRIGRRTNAIAGQGIAVYLSNNVAVLEGTVRTSGDRTLLANILSLEPNVRRIDNRLIVKGSDAVSADHESR